MSGLGYLVTRPGSDWVRVHRFGPVQSTQVLFTYHPCFYVLAGRQVSLEDQGDVTVIRGAAYDAAGPTPGSSSENLFFTLIVPWSRC